MNMLKKIYLSLFSVCCISLLSCGESYEYAKIEPAEFDVEGISLSTDDKGLNYHGNVPETGIKFTITGKGRNINFTRVSLLFVDKKVFNSTQKPLPLSGDWGEINEITNETPYITEFTITPNDTDSTRQFVFDLGGGYWCSKIWLTQDPITN